MLSFAFRRAKKPRLPTHPRLIHSTPPPENAKSDAHKAVAEENKDVSSMDTLLRAGKDRTLRITGPFLDFLELTDYGTAG
ncbi:hypothetical protein JR316_0010971 [Psilocybe cubensis]|uniref:Uncharacterized protein n=1 Tax=Psilocybe cubensis TaxID=181762 RepID=A0ACB8GMT8_PSICU|nr:hypothetical protein JR316_0010971 [Psilocybe cubensis]KAH9477055.1 hypothetical protein JR316_0010971 [Psilocybe cubensis]